MQSLQDDLKGRLHNSPEAGSLQEFAAAAGMFEIIFRGHFKA
jgi:hypothetical protein